MTASLKMSLIMSLFFNFTVLVMRFASCYMLIGYTLWCNNKEEGSFIMSVEFQSSIDLGCRDMYREYAVGFISAY